MNSIYCKSCGRDVKDRLDGYCCDQCQEVGEALKAYDLKKAGELK